jgi:hypothetical protein
MKFAAAVTPISTPQSSEPDPGTSQVNREGYLDKALDLAKVEKFEDAVELWKVYGES